MDLDWWLRLARVVLIGIIVVLLVALIIASSPAVQK